MLYALSKTPKIYFTQKVNSFLSVSSYTVSFPPPSLGRGIFKPYKLYSMTTSEYTKIFNEYRMFVFYYCIKRIPNQEDAEDLTSQVFISLWKYGGPTKINEIKPYLTTIACNKCTDFNRQKRREPKIINASIIEDITEDTTHIDIMNEVLSHIHNIIETLPALQRKFIKMKYIDGHEPSKIAALLNRNKNTIRNQMVTALIKIRKELKSRGFTLG